jgi:hypothetical protein
MNQIYRFLRRRIFFASVISLAAMAYIDYITGYELIFSAAYLVPVSLCAWFLGRREVWLMSIACGFVSGFVDKYSGHTYSHYSILYLNSFVCFFVSVICGLLLRKLRGLMAEREQVNEELRKSLEDLGRSAEEIRKLQNGLQVVCAWTKQIKVGDQWMTPDEFLTAKLRLKLTHGISPEGMRQFGVQLPEQRP